MNTKILAYASIGVGAAAVCVGGVMLGKSAPVAKKKLVDLKANKQDKLTVGEIVKTTWKDILPGVVTIAVGSAAIVTSVVSLDKAIKTATTTAAVATAALSNYVEKTAATVGDKVAEEIRKPTDIPEKKEEPATDDKKKKTNAEIYVNNDVDFRCYDVMSGRYFKANINKIYKAVNEINRIMLRDDVCKKSDWYYELGLTNTQDAEEKGWSISQGLLEYTPKAWIDDDGAPCILVELSREAKDI